MTGILALPEWTQGVKSPNQLERDARRVLIILVSLNLEPFLINTMFNMYEISCPQISNVAIDGKCNLSWPHATDYAHNRTMSAHHSK